VQKTVLAPSFPEIPLLWENVKNCTLIQHFASAFHITYCSFAPEPHCKTSVPQTSRLSSLLENSGSSVNVPFKGAREGRVRESADPHKILELSSEIAYGAFVLCLISSAFIICVSCPFPLVLRFSISMISRGGGENQRIMLHDKI